MYHKYGKFNTCVHVKSAEEWRMPTEGVMLSGAERRVPQMDGTLESP